MLDNRQPLLPARALRDDLRQLVGLLSESHPDPFSGAGGMIPFYRQANEIGRAIDPEGMTAAAFLRLVRPLVASVRDGHTTIFDPNQPDQAVDARAMGGAVARSPRLWIDWLPLDESIVVEAVYDEREAHLLGSRLEAIEGISFDDLALRMRRIRGDDNLYNNLVHLTEALGHPALIFDLLGTEPVDRLNCSFTDRDGTLLDHVISLRGDAPGDRCTPPSRFDLGSSGPSRIDWRMLEDGKGVTLLRIGPMMWYREAFEVWRSYGYHHNLSHHLERLVADLGVEPHPATLDERIGAVPSAGELFVEMIDAMGDAASRTLFVDLRESTGGNSTIASILEFVLYGMDGMIDRDGGYQVRRLSNLFYENNRNQQREESSGLIGGYDFSEEREWQSRRTGDGDAGRAAMRRQIIDQAAMSPSFARLLDDHAPNPGWIERVVVLTSARTYSAGFDMAAMIYSHGATVVGVPPSQSGNCFIDTLRYELSHSQLQGRISYKWSLLFPDDAETGRMLRPRHELNYETFAEMDFDPHATLRLALERVV